jgi:hypothetical protein
MFHSVSRPAMECQEQKPWPGVSSIAHVSLHQDAVTVFRSGEYEVLRYSSSGINVCVSEAMASY